MLASIETDAPKADAPVSLDLGCGENKVEGSVGLDIAPLPGVDVVHNLDQYPYPLANGTFM